MDRANSESGRFKLGEHEATLKALQKQLDEHKVHLNEQDGKLDEILSVLNRAKGSWRTLVLLGGLVTAIVEGIHQIIAWLHGTA